MLSDSTSHKLQVSFNSTNNFLFYESDHRFSLFWSMPATNCCSVQWQAFWVIFSILRVSTGHPDLLADISRVIVLPNNSIFLHFLMIAVCRIFKGAWLRTCAMWHWLPSVLFSSACDPRIRMSLVQCRVFWIYQWPWVTAICYHVRPAFWPACRVFPEW